VASANAHSLQASIANSLQATIAHPLPTTPTSPLHATPDLEESHCLYDEPGSLNWFKLSVSANLSKFCAQLSDFMTKSKEIGKKREIYREHKNVPRELRQGR
jgi:hypothetical protein